MTQKTYRCIRPTSEVQIVKSMPVQTQGNKPTVAIITSKYYEKLAVDAMMEDKTTFVRYKTEGQYLLLLCLTPISLFASQVELHL